MGGWSYSASGAPFAAFKHTTATCLSNAASLPRWHALMCANPDA
jgi:hypothetical protein